MIHFGNISKEIFLKEYWQKKPLHIKNAIPSFLSPLSPDELAGLACEDDFESRIIKGSISDNIWSLENGPFNNHYFSNTPNNEWTLLVQGVDKHIIEIHEMLDMFDFIPRWRFDDVMISFAAKGGSVGPHYDHYDVFLLQGFGKRQWQISSMDCNPDNYVKNSELRIMKTFQKETEFVTEPGDIIYIPPGIAHHGTSLSSECITLSFGYRSYSKNEMLETLDLIPSKQNDGYYNDPFWKLDNGKSEIPSSAIDQALNLLNVEELPIHFFGCFVTKLDPFEQQKFNEIMASEEPIDIEESATYILTPLCRIAYQFINHKLNVYINGEVFDIKGIDSHTIIEFCNARKIKVNYKNVLLAKNLASMHLLERISDNY
jgi:50S ribosomal protein L16 3-hydroxylase